MPNDPNRRRESDLPAWGTRDPSDIRTFYPNELAYLEAIRRRYVCQFCGASAMTCPGCQKLDERIEALRVR